MKTKLLFLISFISIIARAQTVLFTENFESVTNGFTLNTSDLSSSTNNNLWLVNNSFAGGTGSITCLGFPFSFTVGNNPNQPSAITNNPTSKYLHICSQVAVSSGITNSNFIASDGFCNFDENNFVKMSSSISTIGATGINLDFWWMCGGEAGTIYGEVYYSLDNGLSWILQQSNFNSSLNWTQASLTNPIWNNQASLLFGFRFVNTAASSPVDPGFSLDDIVITKTCSTFSSINEVACNTYTSPSGNYTWTSSNTYLDTIPNTNGCDSIITVNLTVNNSSSSTINEVACNSYTSPSGNYTLTSSNTYLDTIPNALGCDSIITINLIVNTVNTSVTLNGITITSNANGTFYQWLDCSNLLNELNGETNQTFTAINNGSYAVEITENGCIDTSSCITINSVGIVKNSFDEKFVIYPNPTSGKFALKFDEVQETILVTLKSITGQLIISERNKNTSLISLEIEAAKGIYILEISNDFGNSSIIKLVKE
jgi:hypothetical protein